MVITGRRLVYEFERRYDRFSSNLKKDLGLVDKLSVINEAIQVFFENALSLAEVNSEYRDILRPLENKEKALKKINVGKGDYIIAEFPDDFYRLLRQKAVISNDCGEKTIPITMFQTDDLNIALKDPYWKPSYRWESVLGDEGKEGLYVWHNKDFTVKEVIIDYFSFPKEVHAPSLLTDNSYTDWNGEVQKVDTNLVFDTTFAYRKIVDIAVLIARANIGDIRDYKVQLENILRLRQI